MSNNIAISGNVGQDSELKDVGANKVLNFNVGSNVNIKTDDGYQDKPIWYQVALWGRQGEALAQYIKKGTPVTVFGEITDAAGYVDKANIVWWKTKQYKKINWRFNSFIINCNLCLIVMADDIDPKTDVYLIPATKGDNTIIKIFINNKCIEKEYTTNMFFREKHEFICIKFVVFHGNINMYA